jgi:hypothetical protein
MRYRPWVCQNEVPKTAEAKKRDIKRLWGDFKARMMRYLDNGKDIGTFL